MKLEVKNINCQSCVNLIKNSLEDEFGTIIIDLTSEPKILTIDINSDEIKAKFIDELNELGFEVIKEI
ncbi:MULTISPECIES: heavy metal transport/detoxification protein [Campylobacter]|uniref:Heavy metal transport/detoxification protein n=1 Tax=Campylobacter vicugnae TaxID=1660076 RepID=A0ABZ2E8Z5_9BACT|nr:MULTISPECIES: heavy metal transport/detoxification protein [Campylobacter]MCR8689501.1 heavy metal transport/detoxification protein [Campylobacter sp. RM9264]MCR8701547.1 heavy metal transport/detoxification protein [Campylobacter sp. RM12176]ARR03592.1 heavy-metal-associated domain protein, putative copper metallochaperone CopZ [Campylobacter sp. RM12175]MBE6429270.1 heavy metal transport/detoxification protein [Campylobacter sp.]MBO5064409.1 heavy metal transport/detoxification protein [C